MPVDVRVVDLVRSYARLRDAAGSSSGSAANLLLFYSVECGLKAAILGKRGINGQGTQHLSGVLRSHDLRRMVKELKIVSCQRQRSYCRRQHDGRQKVDHEDLHQAWRYGAALDKDDEKEAVLGLLELSEWCRREHNR